MNVNTYKKIMENKKLLNHLKENSYYIKYLNRSEDYFKSFENDMKVIYKERVSDKINSAIDGVEMMSNVLDTLK